MIGSAASPLVENHAILARQPSRKLYLYRRRDTRQDRVRDGAKFASSGPSQSFAK